MIFGTLAAKTNDPNVCADFEQAKAAYDKDGYLIYDFGFSDELLEDLATATKSMIGTHVRVQDMWRVNSAVKFLGAHPDVIAFLSKLYARRAFPFQTLNFCVGTQQHTHADSIHFSAVPEKFMCGVWVAFEDIDMENGPLHYYPGSHKRPYAGISEVEAQADGDVVRFFAGEVASYEKDYGIIKKGQAVIWAANVLHGGDPIIDGSRTRLSQVTHYFFDDCLYITPLNKHERPRNYVRYPYDFSTGKFIKGRKDGKAVSPHIYTLLKTHLNKLMKRTPSV